MEPSIAFCQPPLLFIGEVSKSECYCAFVLLMKELCLVVHMSCAESHRQRVAGQPSGHQLLVISCGCDYMLWIYHHY